MSLIEGLIELFANIWMSCTTDKWARRILFVLALLVLYLILVSIKP